MNHLSETKIHNQIAIFIIHPQKIQVVSGDDSDSAIIGEVSRGTRREQRTRLGFRSQHVVVPGPRCPSDWGRDPCGFLWELIGKTRWKQDLVAYLMNIHLLNKLYIRIIIYPWVLNRVNPLFSCELILVSGMNQQILPSKIGQSIPMI